MPDARTPEEFFAGSALGLSVFELVHDLVLAVAPDVEVLVTKSQVAFRRRRGFAFLWRPEQYLRRPASEVVLSLALPHELVSDRFKSVVHPSPTTWMHHLEVAALDDLDAEVAGWLADAARAAAPL